MKLRRHPGTKLRHTMSDGSHVTFKLPAGTSSDKVFSIKGPSGKTERVKIEVQIPDGSKLTPAQQSRLKDALAA